MINVGTCGRVRSHTWCPSGARNRAKDPKALKCLSISNVCFSGFLIQNHNPSSPLDIRIATHVLTVQDLLPFYNPFLLTTLSYTLHSSFWGSWMSFFLVWMSSLEKDVPQLHTVFYVPTRTETWTAHPNAFFTKHVGCTSMRLDSSGAFEAAFFYNRNFKQKYFKVCTILLQHAWHHSCPKVNAIFVHIK